MMTQEQFNQLVEGNVESPVGQYLIVAQKKVSEKTESGVFVGDSIKKELEQQQDLLTIVAVNETTTFKVGQVIRAGRVLTQKTPLVSAVEGYDLAIVMNHDVMTVQQGFSK